MLSDGLVSLYHNSGAFGFGDTVSPQSLGWVGPHDDTIREAALALVRHVPPPLERNLAQLASVVWQHHLVGSVWVMPKTHWAYELDFGSREWMPALLRSIGIDAGILAPRNDGSALEFAPDERDLFVRLVEGLLQRLLGSDFILAFPARSTLCTVHHHKQLWWTTARETVIESLERLVPRPLTREGR